MHTEQHVIVPELERFRLAAVPDGLCHEWMPGAAIQNASLEDVVLFLSDREDQMRCLSYALHTAGLSYALALPRCITLAVDFLQCSFQRLKQGHLDVQVVAATVAHTDVSPQVGFVSPSRVSEIPVKKVLASQCHNVLLATIISDEVTGQMRSHLLFVFCGQYVVVCVGLVEHGWWLLQIFANAGRLLP